MRLRLPRERASQSYESIEGVMTGVQLGRQMKETVENIFIHDRIYEYMMALIHATRKNPYIELGRQFA